VHITQFSHEGVLCNLCIAMAIALRLCY